jgi:hypothetical protein
LILGGGAALALAGGLAIAYAFITREPASTEPPPASQGGLVVQTGRDDDLKLDPKRPLRCFVGGQFVGELPLSVCAQRNGVATGSLDVGIDQSGALAASNGVGADITPLPPEPVRQAPPPAAGEPPTPSGGADESQPALGPAEGEAASADCWRYGGGWRQLPAPLTLSGCVQALYGGRCQHGNEALYGRWGTQTLRLTDGRVEASPDNRDFHALIDPWPGCAPSG